MDIKKLILGMVLEAYDNSSEEVKRYTTRDYLEDLDGYWIYDFLKEFKDKSIENKDYIISIEDYKFEGNDGSDIYVVYKITNKQDKSTKLYIQYGEYNSWDYNIWYDDFYEVQKVSKVIYDYEKIPNN